MENKIDNRESGRRRFIRRLTTLGAAGGIATLLYGRVTEKPLIPPAQAASLTIDALNSGTGNTALNSSALGGTLFEVTGSNTPSSAIYGHTNVGRGLEGRSGATSSPWGQGVIGITENVLSPDLNRIGVHGLADTGAGVVGVSQSGNGVSGYTTSGFGVRGLSQATSSPFSQGVVGLTENSAAPALGAVGVQGAASTGTGVQGSSNTGTAVLGASVSGYCVHGWAWGSNAKPFVAQGYLFGQTANLQEWQDPLGNPLAVVDASGKLGLGTSSPLVPLHIKSASSNPAIRIENENSHVGEFIYCYSNGNIPYFSGRRARGTMASPSAVLADDTLMRYGGSGYGTSGFPGGNRAILEFRAAETWTDSAQGTYITISTTPIGSTVAAERMRITSDGAILPPSNDTGSIGMDGQKWNLVRATNITSGDLTFENGGSVTEDEKAGLAFKNPDGEKIAVLDWNGNFHIKGKVMEDL